MPDAGRGGGGRPEHVDRVRREIRREVDEGNLARVPELVALDASQVVARDDDGRTLLHEAAWYGDAGVAAFLLQAGAAVDARDEDDHTPLHLACRNGHLDVARLLMDHGADVEARGRSGTPLLWTASRQTPEHRAVVDLLLERGATLDLNAALWLRPASFVRDWLAREPEAVRSAPFPARLLLDAVILQSKELVALLLRHGADPNRPAQRSLPIFFAVKTPETDVEIVRLLLEHGADPNAANPQGQRVLQYVEQLGRKDLADLFRRYGAEG